MREPDIQRRLWQRIAREPFYADFHSARQARVKTRQVDTHLVVFMRDDAANVEIERNERCFTGAIDAFLFLANLSVWALSLFPFFGEVAMQVVYGILPVAVVAQRQLGIRMSSPPI